MSYWHARQLKQATEEQHKALVPVDRNPCALARQTAETFKQTLCPPSAYGPGLRHQLKGHNQMKEAYFSALRTRRTALQLQYPEGCCLVMSVDNLDKNSKAGNVCEVLNNRAAQLIVDGTHRLPSDAEAEAYRKDQESARARNTPINSLASARAQFAALAKKDSK